MAHRPLTSYAWLSVAAALATMALKTWAWGLTGSVGLLSDALETLVNLGGALMALMMLWLAAQPPDAGHEYGHGKAEYFASGFEGLLIFLVGGLILVAALPRLWSPLPLEQIGVGLALSTVASVINLVVARVLLSAGRRQQSVALEADARHLLTDVWTSVGVIAGVALVALTGWLILDPLLAVAVAFHILWTGGKLASEAVAGLMDASWPDHEKYLLENTLETYRKQGIDFHALRTRRAATRRFASFHVLVPGAWTVQRGHDLLEEIEAAILRELPNVTVFTHLEPIEDPASYEDMGLDRESA